MVNLPEAGYTPANLRALLKHAGLTQQAAAELMNVDARSVRKWCAPLESDHADMPHYRWVKLLSIVRGIADCECMSCQLVRQPKDAIPTLLMALCPVCWNKRCPKASNHQNECSGSNEPGQKGSFY